VSKKKGKKSVADLADTPSSAYDELFDMVDKYVPWEDEAERALLAKRHSPEDRDTVLQKIVATKHLG
jgi:hypothetical protein